MNPIRFLHRFLAAGLLLTVLALPRCLEAQLRETDLSLLRTEESRLHGLARQMINGPMTDTRVHALQQFIPQLVKTLKTPYSYSYPFDSLKEISIQYPRDSSFRIFTWALQESLGQYRFYGALQLKTRDGTLKLFPFFDNSAYTLDPTDTITSNKAWIGALYYRILETYYRGKPTYTLFGWQGSSYLSNKKLLDILSFRKGRPVFGAPKFVFARQGKSPQVQNRFILEYKSDGNASLNYDPRLQEIVYDHLVSINGQPQKKFTLVPDGTYEGFKWIAGRWVHENSVFPQTRGKTPVPQPMEFKNRLLPPTGAAGN